MMFGNRKIQGQLKVSKDVITTVTKNAVLNTDGVKSIANAKNKVLKNIFLSQSESESIDIDFVNDTVEITISLYVEPGVKVKFLAEQVQNSVKNEVQSMTGVTVSKVNVIIEDVKYN